MQQEHVAELVAKVLYERQYGRVWEDATQWARRDSLSCAEMVLDTLRHSQRITPDAADAGQKPAGQKPAGQKPVDQALAPVPMPRKPNG